MKVLVLQKFNPQQEYNQEYKLKRYGITISLYCNSILTLRLCRNISQIPGSLTVMLQWATSHSITGTESVSSAPRRGLCSPVLRGSRCSCLSISEDSGSGGTSGTMSSWSGTPWRSQSDPSGHRSTPAAISADIICSCPHTTDSPASVRNVFRNLGHCRTSLSCALN